MATLDTDTSAEQVLGIAQAGKLVKDGSIVSGNLLHAHATRTIAADATADTLRIVRLKAGTWVIPEQCYIVHEAGGTAYSMTIGDGDNVDRFSTALDTKAAGTTVFTGGTEALVPVKLTEDTWITATLGTVTTPTVGNTQKFSIAYKGIA